MKRKIILIISIIVIILIIALLLVRYPAQEDSVVGSIVNEEPEQKVTINTNTYYVPVTKFKSYTDDVSVDELSGFKLLAFESDKSKIEDFYNTDNIEFVREDINELLNTLNTSQDETVAFIPLEDLNVQFKVIKVDGKTIFDEVGNYPFVAKESKEVGVKEFLAGSSTITEENLRLRNYQIGSSNFSQDNLTTFFAGGEIITGRGVDIMWLQRSDNNFTFLFDRVKDDIQNADLSVALMEHSYMGNPTPCPKCTAFLGDEALVPQLKEVGMDIFSLAGNHIGDVGGAQAQENTMRLLDENGLKYFGAGANIEEASEPEVVEVNGKKYAFVGADEIAYFFWASDESRGSNTYSVRTAAGTNQINHEKIKTDIERAKAVSDYVVVYMSWGVEYTNYATDSQQELAHAIIDAGADLIVSSHPHWIQNMEVYNGKLIIYSLGNFIFDQTHTDATREAIYVNLNFYDNQLINVEVVPILTCGYHFGAKNLAYDVIEGRMTYEEVDNTNEAQACVWLQPKPLKEDHPKYKVILDRLFEFTTF